MTATGANATGVPGRLEKMVTRFFTWVGTRAWQATSANSQARLTRLGAHATILALAAGAIWLSGLRLPAEQIDGGFLQPPTPAANPGNRAMLYNISMRGGPRASGSETLLVRQADPFTPQIDRPRRGVITYTVQPGDTMFGIAWAYGLQPESILWANPDLKDNPDLLSIGMVLNVPPVDGVIHTVQTGDTVDSIAAKYKVSPEAVQNAPWNNLVRGQSLPAGQSIVVPGGKRELVVWQLPSPSKPATAGSTAASGGWTNAGQCPSAAVSPIGSGKFVWPTNSHRVSGNPYASWHRGIDLEGNTGNPVFAADSGTVLWAGPNSWGYGNMVLLDHGNGWQTLYAHLSQIYVRCGQQILQGATLGAVGSTGRSTGPHLHFETRLNGDLPNPLNSLP